MHSLMLHVRPLRCLMLLLATNQLLILDERLRFLHLHSLMAQGAKHSLGFSYWRHANKNDFLVLLAPTHLELLQFRFVSTHLEPGFSTVQASFEEIASKKVDFSATYVDSMQLRLNHNATVAYIALIGSESTSIVRIGFTLNRDPQCSEAVLKGAALKTQRISCAYFNL